MWEKDWANEKSVIRKSVSIQINQFITWSFFSFLQEWTLIFLTLTLINGVSRMLLWSSCECGGAGLGRVPNKRLVSKVLSVHSLLVWVGMGWWVSGCTRWHLRSSSAHPEQPLLISGHAALCQKSDMEGPSGPLHLLKAHRLCVLWGGWRGMCVYVCVLWVGWWSLLKVNSSNGWMRVNMTVQGWQPYSILYDFGITEETQFITLLLQGLSLSVGRASSDANVFPFIYYL